MHSKYKPYKAIIGLIIGASLLYFLRGYQIIPFVIITICFLSFLFRKIAVFVDAFMERIVQFLGKVFSNIILALMFYLILTPLSLTSKVFSKKDTLVKLKPKKSNYIMVDKVFNKTSFEKLW